MAAGPERSKPLHNFSLPCLKWGTQRLLRCVNADLDRRSSRLDAPQNDAVRVPSKRKMNDGDAVFVGGLREEVSGVANNAMMPWNLRTRRAACKAPQNEEERRFLDMGCSSPSVKEKKKMVLAGNERVKFSVSLSKEEVEEDFWALVGTRPPRRPKKRPRIVQRQLNTLFPGLWLAEVSADSYKVADVPE